MVLAELTAACRVLGDALGHTDPRLLSGVDCTEVVALLARTEKRCAAVRALAAARAANCGAHKARGYSNPERWLADASGITTGEAKAALDTAKGFEQCEQTKEAALAGDVSLAQAAAITKSAAGVPGSEAALLALAASAGVGELKEEARRQRLQAQDPGERHRRQHEEQQVRHWVDDDGMIRLNAALSPELGTPLVNRIDTETDRLAREAKRNGNPEPRERLAAQALANLTPGNGRSPAPHAELVLVCDIAAFQRGAAEPGEVCHIVGAGPVPVQVAVELAAAAFIKAVLHDGVRIHTIAHYGRHLSAQLRTALGLGDPPLFTGAMCADCGRRYGLQWDHVDPVANHGHTSLDNLQALCWPCHSEKTRRDREAGLLKPKPRPPNTADPP